jgi:cytoskeletal protein CcmA (bactofilin family)
MKTRGEGITLNGFLDRGSQLLGELRFEETFRIDGKFEGKIESGAELIIGDTAEVEGEIVVGRLSVNGSVKGKIRATQRIEIHPRARVSADLVTPVLKIEEGAYFEGSCQMAERERSGGTLVGLPSPSVQKV